MNSDLFRTNILRRLLSLKNFNLFGLNEDLHLGRLFIHLFGVLPSRFRIENGFKNEQLIHSLIARYALIPDQIIRMDRATNGDFHTVDYEWSEILLILKEGLLFWIYDNRIDILYDQKISGNELTNLIEHIEKFKFNNAIVKQFHMVKYSKGSFELANFDIKPFNIDIETHYNDDFQDINKLIHDSLIAKDKNGLILLHGKFGSGKTYYLRHLISKVERKFIYFPLNMIESLNSPEFLPFISGQPHSILVLEDCESLLVPREYGTNSASAISNLLNLGDGLLSDALSVNVICTFNAGIKKIDDAILRKGRLLARYEFKELETIKAQALAAKIGIHVNIDHPMTVSDIYNLDEKSFENRSSKAVGFKVA
jgi:ATPase family associated with various cellular activities (AAA)